jgi:hypothetical protein
MVKQAHQKKVQVTAAFPGDRIAQPSIVPAVQL